VGPLVDARGVVAFASPDGQVGVVAPDGALDVLGDPLCARAGSSSSVAASAAAARNPGVFAGIAPAGPAAFVVACESGVIARITSEPR
jgi:hypothetical protein